jgi:hypothetical protein
MKDNLLTLAGAAVGGALGYAIFFWLVRQGLYGLIVPGGLLGLAAGCFKPRSLSVPVVCGVAALVLGVFTEWKFAPFVADEGLGYFLRHLHELKPMTIIMILVGTAIAFWVPFRRYQEMGKQDGLVKP